MMFSRTIDDGLKKNETPEEIHVDGLTGLPDRWQLETWMAERQSINRRSGDRFGLFLISVGNLVEINSGYGSAVGDEVLQTVAEALQISLNPSALLSRYLGSEFAVLTPGIFGDDDATRTADRILASLPHQVVFDSFAVPVHIVVAGVISEPDVSERVLIVDAEAALAEARLGGRGSVVIRGENLGSRRAAEVMSVRLQQAFDEDQFLLYYQPILSLKTGKLVGFEAVLRWLSPDTGPLGAELLSPSIFLEALRTSPIVVPLHAWVLREAANQLAEWTELVGSQSLFMCTNMDPTFISSDRFGEIVRSAINEAGLEPAQLLLDLDGDLVGEKISELWPLLQGLKADGVGLSLEDFGVGYGSADTLRRCRFDVVRLPRVFVGGLGLAEENFLIIKNLINLAHDLGCYVIGEGVETIEQALLLNKAGCDLVQGFMYARPDTSADITGNLIDKIKHWSEMGVDDLA